jgi:uncharacterized Tic20 family protein
MAEAEWLTCPHCGLKHRSRPENICPRCGKDVLVAPETQAAAAPSAITPDERTWAIFSHLGMFIGGPVVPLVALLTRGKESSFVRAHAAAVLNFQITAFVAVFGAYLLFFLTVAVAGAAMVSSAKHGGAGPSIGFGGFQCIFCLTLVVPILGTIFAILGTMAANRGELYRYPLTFRIIS